MGRHEFLDTFLVRNSFPVVEDFMDKDRPEKLAALSAGYDIPEVNRALEALGLDPQRLWSHQVDALEAVDAGLATSITTPTVSGKSVVFYLPTIKMLVEDPHATAMTLYPMKALNADQKISWDKVSEGAGIPSGVIARVDGSDPIDTRDELFKDARMLISTPDAVHSWFMHFLSNPKHQDFLANLKLLNIDETHLYDGYFGTSFSLLVRRMRILRSVLREKRGLPKDDGFQVVSASATMSDPQTFLHQLTGTAKGKNLYDIGPDECGSPSKSRRIMRVRSPFEKREARSIEIVTEILKSDPHAKIMLFIDSRANVERKTRMINGVLRKRADEFPHLNFPDPSEDDNQFESPFLPYRSGFTAAERATIERKFRDPKSNARVLVTTSATEVGIDIASVEYVINASVPAMNSSIVQRAGRLRGNGVAIFVGKSTRGKSVIEQAFEKPPRDPVLYRTHEGAQYQNAMCLEHELRAIGVDPATVNPADHCTLPKYFVGRYRDIVNDVPLDSYIASVLKPGRDKPHYAFPLRSSEGQSVRVLAYKRGDPALDIQSGLRTLEDLSMSHYMQEAHPGAILLHAGLPYRIQGAPTENNNVIARREKTLNTTSPIIHSTASVFLSQYSASKIQC